MTRGRRPAAAVHRAVAWRGHVAWLATPGERAVSRRSRLETAERRRRRRRHGRRPRISDNAGPQPCRSSVQPSQHGRSVLYCIVARGHCDRRPRHCCMSHSDELPSANALSAPQHHLSGTLSLSPLRTVTRSRYSNLDLKHICSPPSLLLNCPVRQRL